MRISLALFREEEGLVFIDLNANPERAAFLAQDRDRVSRNSPHLAAAQDGPEEAETELVSRFCRDHCPS
jgi:hypothetical protein